MSIPWRRIAVVGIGALLLAVPTGAATVGLMMRTRAPEMALRFLPFDATARSARAATLVKPGATPAALAEAETLARTSLERTPLNPVAWRVLGFKAQLEGRRALARQLITQSAKVSRRDLLARIWLIEEAVGRDDLAGALHHYDIAMRTSREGRALLFPILTSAMADPAYREPVAKLFQRRPNWLPEFVQYRFEAAPAVDDLADVLVRANVNEDMAGIAVSQTMIDRLIANDQIVEAYRYFARVQPGARSEQALLIDPTFRRDDLLKPFGWQLVSEPSIGAQRRDGGGIDFYADPGAGGTVATQLLLLRPGRYHLSAREAVSSGDRFGGAVWQIRCRDRQEPLASAPLPRRRGVAQLVIDIPANGCAAQLLELSLRSSSAPEGVSGGVARLDLALAK